MTVSVRSYLTAAIAATVVGAMTIAPVQPSAPTAVSADSIRLTAAVQPLVNDVNTAGASLGQAPAAAAQQPQAQKSAQANNNASDAIDNAYNVIMYWANYWANDLGPYLLGWVPLGYLIADQIQIWYNTFTVPVSASFVYDFLDPVVNDFWNPTVWRDGLSALANTTFASLGQTINAEVYYIVSLQWFPIPLPPLPPLPFAALKTPAAASTTAAADEASAPVEAKVSGTGHSARTVATQSTAATDTTATPETVADTTPSAEVVTDTTATQAVSAKVTTANKAAKTDDSGPVSSKTSSAKSGADTGKKTTGGSARSHGPKAKGGNGS